MNPLTIGIMGIVVIAIAALFLLSRGASAAAPVDWVASIKATLLRLMARGKDLKINTPWSPSAPTSFGYNPGCWAAPLDWTGVANAISGLGTTGGGTLISRRHVLFADHVPYPERPFDIFFTNKAGKGFIHKVTKIDNVTGTDIAIGTLDRDVDASLPVYRVLPDGWERQVAGATVGTAMGSTVITLRLPVLFTNQDRFALTGDLTRVLAGLADVNPPTFEAAQSYYMVTRGGDSGNPIFTLVGDSLVLLGSWYQVGRFPWMITYRKEIEAIIGQKLLVADLRVS